MNVCFFDCVTYATAAMKQTSGAEDSDCTQLHDTIARLAGTLFLVALKNFPAIEKQAFFVFIFRQAAPDG